MAYEAGQIESKYYKIWEERGHFETDANADIANGKSFCIMMPPPNVTGVLHIGHALTFTLQDIMTRYKRMDGYKTLWQPGLDHAGIATQNVVEKQLLAQGIKKEELGREKFLERVWEWKEKSGGQIVYQMRRLGISPAWSRERFTMDEGLKNAVREAFCNLYEANELLVAESREDESKSGMGTTLVIGTIIGNKLFVANIGDSRLYVVGQNMRQITRDHSLVDEMVRLGEINADEARVHPDKNIITRAVGTSDHVEADFFEVEITADDTILLCTDGLTNMVRDDEILDIIKKYDNAQAATMQLVKEANANGGRDNITVMIIKPF